MPDGSGFQTGCFFVVVVVVMVMTSPSGTAYMGGGQKCPEEMRNYTRLWIRLSLMVVDSHFFDWGTTQGRLSLPTADVLSTIVKQSMLTDVDKLSSCSRFFDSGSPTASKY